MPTYGRTFTLSDANNYKVNSPASGGGKAGEYTKEGGFLAYYEVIMIKKYCSKHSLVSYSGSTGAFSYLPNCHIA